MDSWNDDVESKYQLKKFLRENNYEFSFNPNPERFISKSLSPTKLTNYLKCPKCFFSKENVETENNLDVELSNSIHYIVDYITRHSAEFPKSRDVLNLINFTDGNLLEKLKTDEENENYDILQYLSEANPEAQQRILRGVLFAYGTAKRLGFEEVRKKDSISLNLKNSKNNSQSVIYTKPDYTGRHKTTLKKHHRKYDNFLIDYKLNFSTQNKSSSIQTCFYYLTHILSNRGIHHYYIQDLSSGILYELEKINPILAIKLINKFLVFKKYWI